MAGSFGQGWRRTGVMIVAAALALGAGSTLLAQTPPGTSPGTAPAPTPTGLPIFMPAASAAPQPTFNPVPQPSASPTSPSAASPSPAADGSSAASPSPSPSGSSAPSGSPAPSAAPPPVQPPPLTENGVTVVGVFASDWDEMITIADEFQVVALVRAPGIAAMTMRLSGAPFLRASAAFDLQPGDNWLQIPAFRVDTENEPVLREEIIRKVGGVIPIRDGALVMALDFKDAAGNDRTVTFEPVVQEFNNPGRIARVEYPDLKRITGMPPGSAPVDSYYLRGDEDFHHPDDFYVRKLAIEAGRRGDIFSDDPELVADNVFTYINSLLGDAEPGDFNNDYNMARLIDEGTIKRGQSNGGYICIGQTYFMTALTRTLGIPSRELNIAVGKPNWLGNDGVWRVIWWQEGAIHTWYNGQWNHYDLWLGFKGLNGYFTANLAYQAWAAFNRQSIPFVTIGGANTGLRGHDFNAFPGDPPQFEFVREATKPGVRVLGMPDENGDPITHVPGFEAYLKTDGPGGRRGPAVETAQPPASGGILAPPETRP